MKKPIEEFMREYIRDAVAEEQRVLASRTPFRRNYYSDECLWDSRAGTLETLRSEKIESVTVSGSEAAVITERESQLGNRADSRQRLRYHLKDVNGSWLISEVEVECPMCRGKQDNACIFCGGTRWRGAKI